MSGISTTMQNFSANRFRRFSSAHAWFRTPLRKVTQLLFLLHIMSRSRQCDKAYTQSDSVGGSTGLAWNLISFLIYSYFIVFFVFDCCMFCLSVQWPSIWLKRPSTEGKYCVLRFSEQRPDDWLFWDVCTFCEFCACAVCALFAARNLYLKFTTFLTLLCSECQLVSDPTWSIMESTASIVVHYLLPCMF